MIFRDMELDFDIFDAEDAEIYEEAAKRAKEEAVKKPGESLADCIRRQCGAVFNFFDTLFGPGFHRDLFGERTNLVECLEAFREFIGLVNDQRSALDTMIAEVKAEGAAPNRAMRRAAARAPKP